MKAICWKYIALNFLIGGLSSSFFYFGACFHFREIHFFIQKNSEVSNFYNFWGNNFGIVGFLILSIYFANLFWTFNKFFLENKNTKIENSTNPKFINFVYFLFSKKTQIEVFEPMVMDWQEEYFEALFKKEIWKARWINVRYTYAFLVAMWQKSPLGDLIEFISKIAK